MHVSPLLVGHKTRDRGYDGQLRIPLLRVDRTLRRHLARMKEWISVRVRLLWLPLRHPSKPAPLRMFLRWELALWQVDRFLTQHRSRSSLPQLHFLIFANFCWTLTKWQAFVLTSSTTLWHQPYEGGQGRSLSRKDDPCLQNQQAIGYWWCYLDSAAKNDQDSGCSEGMESTSRRSLQWQSLF